MCGYVGRGQGETLKSDIASDYQTAQHFVSFRGREGRGGPARGGGGGGWCNIC